MQYAYILGGQVRISVEANEIKNECFVIMPFQAKFDVIYEDVIAPAIREAGLNVLRGDEVYGTQRVMEDVWKGIREARIVLAELTGRNANVLYELGLAHAIGKEVIIIVNAARDVPFDLRDIRCIVYETSHPRWGEKLGQRITVTIKNVLAGGQAKPLLSGIAANLEYPVAPEVPVISEEPVAGVDVSGEWESLEVWPAYAPNPRHTRVQLEQNGVELSGTARTVGPNPEEPEWVVEQNLFGHVIDRQLRLVSISFEISKSPGDQADWDPDSWRGTVETPNLISGDISSGNPESLASPGKFTMRRI